MTDPNTIRVNIEGRDVGLTSVINGAVRGMKQLQQEAIATQKALSGVDNAATQARNELMKNADATKTASIDFGDLTSRASFAAGSFYILQAAATSLGQALLVPGIEMEKLLQATEALSGGAGRFNEVMSLARKEQGLYGGSLKENVENLQSFIYLSNQTGVSLENLANVARRLAVLDPVQGIAGAGVALKELFAGDTISLSKRFEIDPNTLRSIDKLATSSEKLVALDAELERMGIGMDLLEGRTQLTATTYEKFTGAVADATAELSKLILEAMKGETAAATSWIDRFTDAIENMNQKNALAVAGVVDDNKRLERSAIATGQSFVEYFAAMFPVTKQAYDYGVEVRKLTPAQLEFAQSLYQSGTSLDDTILLLDAYADKVHKVQAALELGQLGTLPAGDFQLEAIDAMTARAQNLTLEFARLSVKYPEISQGIQHYVDLTYDGVLSTDQATAAIYDLVYAEDMRISMLNDLSSAQTETTATLEQLTAAAKENTAATIDATAKSDLFAKTQDLVRAYAEAAAKGILNTEAALLILQNRFGLATDQANLLIGALGEIAGLQAEAELVRRADEFKLDPQMIADWSAQGLNMGEALSYFEDLVKLAEEEQKALEAARIAREKYNYSQLDSAGKIKFLRNELNKYNTTQEEYWDTLQKIADLEKKGSKAGATATDKALKDRMNLLYDLMDIQIEFNKEAAQAEKDHQANIQKILRESGKKQAEIARQNEVGKRTSRADFYKDLPSFEGIDAQSASAAYETAFAEAMRIAQEGRASLAKEFLDLRTDQIQEMMKLESDMAGISADKDMSPGAKANRLEYLQGVKKLMEDAQAEQLKQLLAGGDSVQKAQDDQLKSETDRYAEQVRDLGIKAGEAADAKVLAAGRGKDAVLLENEAIQAQVDLLKEIQRLTNEKAIRLEGTMPTVPAVPVPTPVVPEGTTGGVGGYTLQFPEIMLTHDRVLNETVHLTQARIENKLATLIDAVQTSDGNITRAISNIPRPTTKLTDR